MKKITTLILIILLIICFNGCSSKSVEQTENSTPIVIVPDEQTKSTVNGYKTITEIQNTTTDEQPNNNTTDLNEYYVNISTQKFHLGTCTYAKKIKSENLLVADNRTSLISDGYTPCKKCNP